MRIRERGPLTGGIGVVTDAAAGLDPATTARWEAAGGFVCLDLPLLIEDQIYSGTGPGEEPDPGLQERLVIAAAEGRRMSTSRPSPGAFATAYRRLAEQGCPGIVSVHLSGELSGTVEAARAAARTAPVPVLVLDTREVAMAQGFAVAAAVRCARSGADAEAVLAAAEVVLEHVRLLFYVPALEQLARSGRIPRGLARVGQMLQIKPIGTVSEGRLRYLERPRQEAAAQRRFTDLVLEDLAAARAQDAAVRGLPVEQGRAEVAIHEFYGRPLADALHQRVEQEAGALVRIHRSVLPAALAVHAGLGPVAAVAVPQAWSRPQEYSTA